MRIGIGYADIYGMDLVSGISGLQQAQTMAQVQIRVAQKIMAMQRMQGDSALQLIEAAGRGVEKAGDQLVADATGLGGLVDVKA